MSPSGELFEICELDWSMRRATREELLYQQMEHGSGWSSRAHELVDPMDMYDARHQFIQLFYQMQWRQIGVAWSSGLECGLLPM